MTMQALVKYEYGPFKIRQEECVIPQPGPEQVRIKVLAAGLCGTDVHVYRDDSRATNPPVIMGHEMAGVVDMVGSEVIGIEEGADVTAEPCVYTCGECEYCFSGHENLCSARQAFGSAVDGAFAEYVVVPSQNVHLLPQGFDPQVGALAEPLACCVQAVEEFNRVSPGDTAVVFGPGTIGLLCTRLLVLSGARVVVVGTAADQRRLVIAESLGADSVLTLGTNDGIGAVREVVPNGVADAVFECSGSEAAIRAGLSLTKRGRILTQVGLAGEDRQLPIDYITYNEIQVRGTFAQKRSVWPKAVRLVIENVEQLRALITHTFPLSAWQDAFEGFNDHRGIKFIFDPTL